MGFFPRTQNYFFSKSVFALERSLAPKLRGSIKKKMVHLYRSTRQKSLEISVGRYLGAVKGVKRWEELHNIVQINLGRRA